MVSAGQWALAAPLILALSLLGIIALWHAGGKELYEDIKQASPKDLASRWASFSPGQKRFIWLASLLLGPVFAVAAFAFPWLSEEATGIEIDLPITFTEALLAQIIILHLGLLYLQVVSKRSGG